MGALSLVVIAQAVAGVLVVTSPGWRGPQAVLAGVGAVLVCGAALAIYRQQVAEKVREHASRVYISTQRSRNEDGSLTVVARVHNGSEAPIWHVEIRPRRDGNPYGGTLTQRLPDVLPAMSEEWEWRVDEGDAPYEERYPELLFLDSNERRWRRVGARLELLGG